MHNKRRIGNVVHAQGVKVMEAHKKADELLSLFMLVCMCKTALITIATPILMTMLKNVTLFSVTETLDPQSLNDSLEKMSFRPCAGLEPQSAGFVPFADGLDLIHGVAGLMVGAVRVDKKTVPSSAVKQMVKERSAQVEQEQGYKPGRKQTREIKEQVLDSLMPRAIPATKIIRFMFTDRLLMIEATSAATADLVIGLLAKCLDPFPLGALQTDCSAATSMTEWLINDEAPAGFTIDQEVEMKAPSKAMVRWANDMVKNDEAQNHLKQGKQCTKMALTWNDKISFVLTERMVLTKIKALDVNREQDDEFDSDDIDGTIALYGNELRGLAESVIDALGGLMKD